MINTPDRQRARRSLPHLLGLSLLALVLLTACTPAAPGAQKMADKQILRFPMILVDHVLPSYTSDGKATSGLQLDPAYLKDVSSQRVLNMTQLQLVTFDSALKIIPDAATWKISSDGLTYTFSLRPNLKWSDGTSLTSRDFLFGLSHILDPNLTCTPGPYVNPSGKHSCPGNQPQASFLTYIQGANEYSGGKAKSISGVQAPDDQTITYKLTQPYAFFLQVMAIPAGMPIEASTYNKYGSHYVEHLNEGIAQSGPFMITGWNNPADPTATTPQQSTELHLKPNPYWSGKTVNLKQIDMPLYDNRDQTYQQYLNGNIDFSEVPGSQYPFVQDLKDFHQIQALAILYFGMNQLLPPFNNLQLRQALDLALNKQFLVDGIYQGSMTPTNHIIPLGIAGYNQGLLNPPDATASAALTGDQDRAKQMITILANDCAKDITKDWCRYIVGKAPLRTDTTSLPGKSECAKYKIGTTTGSDGTVTTAQQPITLYVANTTTEGVAMARQSAQLWNNILCLNMVVDSSYNSLSEMYNNAVISGTGQMWEIGYTADYPDPQDFITLQFNNNPSAGIGNDENFSDPQIISQMLKADAEQDSAMRIKMYSGLEQALVWNVAWIPWGQQKLIYVLKPTVANFTIPADQVTPDLSWPDVYIAAS